MENFEWRVAARIVAIIDTILSVLALVAVGFLVVIAGIGTAQLADNRQEIASKADVSEDQITAVMVILWFIAAIFAVVTILNIWAAVMLLKATEQGAGLIDAHRRATIWRNVTITFFVFWVIGNLAGGNLIGLLVGGAIRTGIIYVVCKFIGELRDAMGVSGLEAGVANQKL